LNLRRKYKLSDKTNQFSCVRFIAVMSDFPFKAPVKNPFSVKTKQPATSLEQTNRVQSVVNAVRPEIEIPVPEEELPPLSMEEKTCRSCQFYDFDKKFERHDAYAGECRRHAPVPGPEVLARWPKVTWKGWCGEWENGVSHEDMVRMARDIGESLGQGQDKF